MTVTSQSDGAAERVGPLGATDLPGGVVTPRTRRRPSVLRGPGIAPEAPVALVKIPVLDYTVYLNDFMTPSIHNVWVMVAIAILGAFSIKGICDYFGNYLINYVGLAAVTDLRQRVFDRVLRQDSQFFESNSTGRLMSSIMNDIEKIQVATSHILADWLRQSFTVIFLLWVVMQKDWRLAHCAKTN